MAGANPFLDLLSKIPTSVLAARLVRKVAYGPLASLVPPNFLFTSGRRNRYNPTGVDCIYFSENEQTADLEYRRDLPGQPGEFGPVVTYWADAQFQRVLDLTDPAIVKALGLNEKDLSLPWRETTAPVVTQVLGEMVARHSVMAAIRYPSDAARNAGVTGVNVVIYRERIVAPDQLIVLGPDGNPFQGWP